MTAERRTGWLHKLGAVHESWKLRFFVLGRGRLRYYASAEDRLGGLAGKGEVEILGSRLLRLDSRDYGRPYSIGLTPPLSGRTYVLSCESEGQLQEWVTDMLSEGAVLYDAGGGATAATASSTSAPAAAGGGGGGGDEDEDDETSEATAYPLGRQSSRMDPRSLKEGFLTKQGGIVKSWKRRYFVLFPHALLYYRRLGDTSAAGEIPLVAGARVEIMPPGEGPPGYPFFVQPELPSCGGRKWLIVAESDDERREWVSSISRAALDQAADQPVPTGAGAAAAGSLGTLPESDSDAESGAPLPPPAPLAPLALSSGARSMTRSYSAASTAVPVTAMEGWVRKRGGVVRNWKERYAVLEASGVHRGLRYFALETDEAPLGEVPISAATEAAAVDDPAMPKFTFSVRSEPGARVYLIQVPSAEARDVWLRAIDAVRKGHAAAASFAAEEGAALRAREASSFADLRNLKDRSPVASATGTPTRPAAAASVSRSQSSLQAHQQPHFRHKMSSSSLGLVHPESVREGYLVKLTQDGQRWHHRYFVVAGGRVHYYAKKPSVGASLETDRRFPVAGSVVRVEDPSVAPAGAGSSHWFSVQPAAGRKFVLGADSREELDGWLAVLREQATEVVEAASRGVSQKEGFLNALVSDVRGASRVWSRRYYVLLLERPVLQEFSSADGGAAGSVPGPADRPSRELDVSDVGVRLVSNDRYGRPCTFEASNSDRTRSWVLSCVDRDELESWVDAISGAAPTSLEWRAEQAHLARQAAQQQGHAQHGRAASMAAGSSRPDADALTLSPSSRRKQPRGNVAADYTRRPDDPEYDSDFG